jgi:hypothetical protein
LIFSNGRYTSDHQLWHGSHNLLSVNDVHLSVEKLMELDPKGRPPDFVQVAAEQIMSNSHDTLTFLVELKKTKQMFIKMLKRLRDPKTFIPKTKQHVAGAWLEARYGWRPLIYDIISLQKAMAHMAKGRTRFSQQAGSSFPILESEEVISPEGIYYKELKSFTSGSVSMRGNVTADIKLNAFSFNPIVTAWELVPYSFLIDWLIDIGSMLSALSFSALSTHYEASESRMFNVIVTRNMELKSFGGNEVILHRGNTTCVASVKVRTPTRVSFKPQMLSGLSLLHGVDAIALIVKFLQKIR